MQSQKVSQNSKYFIEIENIAEDYRSLKEYVLCHKTFNFFITQSLNQEKNIIMLVQFIKGTNIQGLQKKFFGKYIKILPAKLSLTEFKKKVISIRSADNYMECYPEDKFPDEKKITIEEFEAMTPDELKKLPMSNFNTVKALEKKKKNTVYAEDMGEMLQKSIKVYYIWGPSGYGKTRMALRMIKEWMEKYTPTQGMNTLSCVHGFWNGVGENASAALFDDFRDNNLEAEKFINFIDYTVSNMNTKGSYDKNLYKLIIITSVQSPFDLYKNKKESEVQWLRRMQKIYLKERTDRGIVVPPPEKFSYGTEPPYDYITITRDEIKNACAPGCVALEKIKKAKSEGNEPDDLPNVVPDEVVDAFEDEKTKEKSTELLGKKREKEDSVDSMLEMIPEEEEIP